MKTTKKFDAVAIVGEYQDATGQTKKRYQTVGAVLQKEDGSMALKLESLPLSADWNGWINFFEPKQK